MTTSKPKTGKSMADYRAWYKPVLEMTFAEQDQAPPVLRWQNNVRVDLPWPRGKVWLEATSNKTGAKCEVWLCLGHDRRTLEALLKPMTDDLVGRLPLDSKRSKFKSGQWTIGREQPWPSFENDDAKRAWLIETLNAFVTVLRPLLRNSAGSLAQDLA